MGGPLAAMTSFHLWNQRHRLIISLSRFFNCTVLPQQDPNYVTTPLLFILRVILSTTTHDLKSFHLQQPTAIPGDK
jgi:hypothetical protein